MEQQNQSNPEPTKTQNNSPQTAERADRKSFKRTSSNGDIRLRENYIIKRDNHYAQLKNQIETISIRPDFNRFISIKKNLVSDNQNLLASLSISNQEEKEKKNTDSKGVNRKRLLHMKRFRPDHNSPLRERGAKQVSHAEGTQKKLRPINLPPKLILPQDESDNAMMIKQMVTHIQQVNPKQKIAIQDPYSPKSKLKYYVAEVIKNYSILDSLVRDHIFNSIYFLQMLSKYNNTSDFARDKPIKLVQKEQYIDKITVVFDLDETLVHCFEQLSEPHQIELPVTFPGGFTMVAPINIRPYAKQLLAELSKDFEIIIFTASHESYANVVIDYLDPNKEYVQHRLYRRHCDYIQEGYYVKDLRLLDREIERVVLVDNAAYSYCFQINNGIPILPYYQGDKDFELKALRDYLYRLREYPDVRTLNASTFKLSHYNRFTYVQQLVETLYNTK